MHGLMKRGVIIISLLIISCLSFVGCGKKYISETKAMYFHSFTYSPVVNGF